MSAVKFILPFFLFLSTNPFYVTDQAQRSPCPGRSGGSRKRIRRSPGSVWDFCVWGVEGAWMGRWHLPDVSRDSCGSYAVSDGSCDDRPEEMRAFSSPHVFRRFSIERELPVRSLRVPHALAGVLHACDVYLGTLGDAF